MWLTPVAAATALYLFDPALVAPANYLVDLGEHETFEMIADRGFDIDEFLRHKFFFQK